MNTLQDIPRLIAERKYEELRAIPMSRYTIRTMILPLVREQLGEIPPVRVRGLSSNWAGKSLMSRNAV